MIMHLIASFPTVAVGKYILGLRYLTMVWTVPPQNILSFSLEMPLRVDKKTQNSWLLKCNKVNLFYQHDYL